MSGASLMEVIEWQGSRRAELRSARDADAMVVVPVGACEQHGPHLPAGTDAYIVGSIARDAARHVRARNPIVIAPTIPIGQSRHHHVFGATLSVTTATLSRYLSDVAESVFRSGFRRILLLNGHGGNAALIEAIAAELATDRQVAVGAASYWRVAEVDLETFSDDDHPIPGHAGRFETSLMLALHPDLVVMDALPDDGDHVVVRQTARTARIEPRWSGWSTDGFSDRPHSADAVAGSQAYDRIVEAVAEVYRLVEAHSLDD